MLFSTLGSRLEGSLESGSVVGNGSVGGKHKTRLQLLRPRKGVWIGRSQQPRHRPHARLFGGRPRSNRSSHFNEGGPSVGSDAGSVLNADIIGEANLTVE